jgi:hypothetical protein
MKIMLFLIAIITKKSVTFRHSWEANASIKSVDSISRFWESRDIIGGSPLNPTRNLPCDITLICWIRRSHGGNYEITALWAVTSCSLDIAWNFWGNRLNLQARIVSCQPCAPVERLETQLGHQLNKVSRDFLQSFQRIAIIELQVSLSWGSAIPTEVLRAFHQLLYPNARLIPHVTLRS